MKVCERDNTQRDFNVDDLIVEYMLYRIKNNYDSNFSISEFMEFLNFAKNEIDIYIPPYVDDNELFLQFYERKRKSGVWGKDDEYVPHLNMDYNDDKGEWEIKANEKFTDNDSCFIEAPYSNMNNEVNLRHVFDKYLSPETLNPRFK